MTNWPLFGIVVACFVGVGLFCFCWTMCECCEDGICGCISMWCCWCSEIECNCCRRSVPNVQPVIPEPSLREMIDIVLSKK